MLTGVIVALLALAAIYAYSAFRPVPSIDADFGPDKTSFSVPMPPDEVYRVVEALPVSAHYKLGRADAQRRRVILQDSMSLSSYGYYYPVDIAPAGEGSQVTVGIKPKYPLQIGPIVRRQREKYLGVMVEAVKAKLAGSI
jgi:hypothetical protein